MSYCINPECPSRQNPDTVTECQTCGTELVLQGRYRVLSPLVPLDPRRACDLYEVDDRGQRRVLKILKWQDPKYIELFEREAITLQDLNHKGIPKGYGLFKFLTAQNDKLYGFVMDKIPGQNLEIWIQNNPHPTERFVVNCLRQLVQILDYLHHSGYIHRDIKPANIMLTLDQNVVLIDFGSVQMIGHSKTRIISDGYTAPEQIELKAGPESDIYALGRTIVHLITGIHPTLIKHDQSGHLFWQSHAIKLSTPVKNLVDELIAQSIRARTTNPLGIEHRLKPQSLLGKRALSLLRLIFPSSILQYIILLFVFLISYPARYLSDILRSPRIESLPEESTNNHEKDEELIEKVKRGLEARINLARLDPSRLILKRYSKYYHNLGVICYTLDEIKCASENFKKSIKISSSSNTVALSQYQMGIIHEEAIEFEEAISWYKDAISKVGEDSSAYPLIVNRYARLLIWDRGDFEDVLAKSERLLGKLDSAENIDISITSKNLGWASLEKGDLKSALEYLLQSIEADDSDATPYCLLAQVREAQINTQDAQYNNIQDIRKFWQECESKPNEYNLPETRTWQQQATRYLRTNEL